MKLYKLFLKYDCTQIGRILYWFSEFLVFVLLEINPFGETPDKRGNLV